MRKIKTTATAAIAISLALSAFPATAHAASTVKSVQQRGVVRCSISTAAGFASHDEQGRPVGFMVDLCRVIAAAVLGNAEAIDLRPFPRKREMDAIENHEVDISIAQNSWTQSREPGRKTESGPAVFYDSEGMAAWSTRDTKPDKDRPGATVCATAGTSAKRNVESLIRSTGKKWTVRAGNTWEETLQAFLARECSIIVASRAQLTNSLHGLPQSGNEIEIYPDRIAREAFVPVVASDDHQWRLVVRWAMFALVLAEEKGITAANAQDKRNTGDLETKRLLGGVPSVGAKLGLPEDWAFQIISKVGNYGEIFDRNVGSHSPYHLDRGANKPWSDGGLLYSPPFQ